MSEETKNQCCECKHGICKLCKLCHNMDCGAFIRPFSSCFDQLLPKNQEEKLSDFLNNPDEQRKILEHAARASNVEQRKIMKLQATTEDWEKEFDQKFPYALYADEEVPSQNDKIIDFIKSALQNQRDSFVGMVKGKRMKYPFNTMRDVINHEKAESYQNGHNNALEEILDSLR